MDNEVDEIALLDYKKVLWKRKWAVADIALFSTTGAVVAGFYFGPAYRVTTVIELAENIPEGLTRSIFSKLTENICNDVITRVVRRAPLRTSSFTVEDIVENGGDMSLVRISMERPDSDEGRLVLEEVNMIHS